jgi:XapX domain-containing protein
MKPYLLSLAAGLLVGVVYSLLNVRSPAPPIIALVGLLGILIGEQLPPLARQLLTRGQTEVTWIEQQVKPHMFGHLPKGERLSKDVAPAHDKQEHDA